MDGGRVALLNAAAAQADLESMVRLAAMIALALAVGSAPRAHTAEASHAGWPQITGIFEKNDASGGMIDARPGDGLVAAGGDQACAGRDDASDGCPGPIGHNELLGADGSDTIYGGNDGDVIWGDYLPSGQPASQRDYLHGGDGDDWIYSSHGFSHIWTGAGNDHVALVYGHGIVTCNGPGLKTLVMRKLVANRHWALQGCTHTVIVPYAA